MPPVTAARCTSFPRICSGCSARPSRNSSRATTTAAWQMARRRRWRAGSRGRRRPGLSARARPQPAPLPGLEAVAAGRRAVDVAGGFSFGLVLLEDGTVIGHGFNDRFQLGLGDRSLRPTPTPIPMFDVFAVPITQIACGQQHSAALDRDGDLFTWGFGAFGQLGHGGHRDERRPRRVEALETMPARAAACGDHTPSCCCESQHSPPTTGPPRVRRRSGASATQNGVSWGLATTAAPARRRAILRRRGR